MFLLSRDHLSYEPFPTSPTCVILIPMEFSLFGQKLAGRSGIQELMDDLGNALSSAEKKYMLGGGNPAHIPEINKLWRSRVKEIWRTKGSLEALLANYDTPQGSQSFLRSLAHLLRVTYGWDLSEENIALTNGSQNAFFLLFNLLAGDFGGGKRKKILFPLAPEYIGYADQALGPDSFVSHKARIDEIGDIFFKYRVDFDTLQVGEDVGAICASRPTNPTGNVLTDEEVLRLAALAQERDIPFLLDNAYGTPFPGIIFSEVQPFWSPSMVLVLSLSKLGLPGTRTGIIVARKEIIKAVAASNAVMNLAGGNVGPALVQPLIDSGRILEISHRIIRPYYEKRMLHTLELIRSIFEGRFPYRVHKPEGALFLWLWFPQLKITAGMLYERLKARNTLVVPGHYFFFGLDQKDPQAEKCIRITYSQNPGDVEAGLKIIAEEVERSH